MLSGWAARCVGARSARGDPWVSGALLLGQADAALDSWLCVLEPLVSSTSLKPYFETVPLRELAVGLSTRPLPPRLELEVLEMKLWVESPLLQVPGLSVQYSHW